MNTNPTTPETTALMTKGDALAELDRTGMLPQVEQKPKSLYTTKEKLLEPADYVIAVSSSGIAHNARLYNEGDFISVIEVWRVGPGGTLRDHAVPVVTARHVEILGPSWIHHDPSDTLVYAPRRATLLRTRSALRIYVDDEAQIARSGEAIPGC